MRPACLSAAAIMTLIAATLPVAADTQPNVAAKQVAGLFMQSCVRFTGDRDGLREWAVQTGLKTLPQSVQDRFLSGLPGQVFDASNKDGKFVLVSEDGGPCSVIAEMASGTGVITALEQDLNEARISFRMTAEKSDPQETDLRHREYQASKGERGWLLLVSTVRGSAGGQAMLTANRL